MGKLWINTTPHSSSLLRHQPRLSNQGKVDSLRSDTQLWPWGIPYPIIHPSRSFIHPSFHPSMRTWAAPDQASALLGCEGSWCGRGWSGVGVICLRGWWQQQLWHWKAGVWGSAASAAGTLASAKAPRRSLPPPAAMINEEMSAL